MSATTFDVSILLRLIDQLTGPGKKAAAGFRGVSQSISQSAAAMRNASTGAATGVAAIGNSAQRANRQVSSFMGSMRKMNSETARGRGSVVGGNADTFRAIGGMMALRKILSATEDSAKAENMFRGLVDNVSPQQMLSIRKTLDKQMLLSGETYAELMTAAANAAQIVGDAKLSGDIAVAASKLGAIDTAGQSVSQFADNMSAVVGKGGTLEEIIKLGDMLAMQQKLGAATAGGTFEAYKNVVGYKGTMGFDQAEMLTAIGLIKNKAPAFDDSQIGNMAKYGLRMFNQPTESDLKKLKGAGFTPKSFLTDGNFDIAKTQQLLHELSKTKGGMDKVKKLFSGRNVLAGQFWQMLLGFTPEEFEDYRAKLTGGVGSLEKAFKERTGGIICALNSLRGSAFLLARSFGELLTPALIWISKTLAPLAASVSLLTSSFAQAHPVLSGAISGWLALAGALGIVGLVWARAGRWARTVLRFPFLLGRVALAGIAGGLIQGAMAIGAIAAAAMRAGGAVGALLFGMRALGRIAGIGLAIEGVAQIYQNWDKLKALLRDPLTVNILFPEAPWYVNAFLGQGAAATNTVSGALECQGSDSYTSAVNQMNRGWGNMFGRWFGGGGTPPGVPEAVGKKIEGEGQAGAPAGVTVQANGPNVTFNQAPPNVSVSVTVNATTNASPEAIGAAAASAVGNKVRGALSDAPASAP